jgi:hypothetical protein
VLAKKYPNKRTKNGREHAEMLTAAQNELVAAQAEVTAIKAELEKTPSSYKDLATGNNDLPTSIPDTATTGMSVDEVKTRVDAIASKMGANTPRIVVMRSPSEFSSNINPLAAGSVRNGNVYVFADNLHDAAHLEEVLYHEIKGHAGLRGFFGDRLDKALVALHASSPKIRQAAERERAKNPERFKRMTPDQAIAKSTEEVLSNLAGAKVEGNGLTRFIATVIKALRAMGLGKFADMLDNATMATALDMLTKAGSYVREGKTNNQGVYTEVKLDAATSTKTRLDKWFAGSKVVDANGRPLRVYHGSKADIKSFLSGADLGGVNAGIYFTTDTGLAST